MQDTVPDVANVAGVANVANVANALLQLMQANEIFTLIDKSGTGTISRQG